MNIHLPIAVCLMSASHGLELSVHQVKPGDPRSLGDFVDRQCGRLLLHHIIFFTSLSYAECQQAIRRFVARRAGAVLPDGRKKDIRGDPAAIAEALTAISMDNSTIEENLRRGPFSDSEAEAETDQAPNWRDDSDDSENDSVNSLADFVVDDEEDDDESDDDDEEDDDESEDDDEEDDEESESDDKEGDDDDESEDDESKEDESEEKGIHVEEQQKDDTERDHLEDSDADVDPSPEKGRARRFVIMDDDDNDESIV